MVFSVGKELDEEKKNLFRSEWAIKENVELKTPFAATEWQNPEGRFRKIWKRHREIYLSNLVRPNLDRHNLRKAQLEGAFLPGVKLRKAILTGANLFGARLEGADLTGARLESADLTKARLEGANLIGARLKGADLTEARLKGADLTEARLFGVKGKMLNLNSTILKGAKFTASALRMVDLSTSKLAELRSFENSFGDRSVTVPDGFKQPCQWGKVVLSKDAYFGRWRGWLEKGDGYVEGDLKKYKAIPPDDKDCKWKPEK